MADFVNTIDILGDDAVVDSIIDRSITEFKDDTLTTIETRAFYNCSELIKVDLPNVTTIGSRAFAVCKSLVSANIPSVTVLDRDFLFDRCSNLKIFDFSNIVLLGASGFSGSWSSAFSECGFEELHFNNIINIGRRCFYGCKQLKKVDIMSAEKLTYEAFLDCTNLSALILRGSNVCEINDINIIANTAIYSAKGGIYVQRALVDNYKAATHWSQVAEMIKPLEDYTVDGTITGEFVSYSIDFRLIRVESSNSSIDNGPRNYSTVLTSINTNPISEITVTMGGVDVTATVYNAETGEINIPVVTGDISIVAKSESDDSDIMAGIGFNAGYINPDGSINSGGTADVYTDKFEIGDYAGSSITITLVDVKSTPSYSRIIYYDVNSNVVGNTQGVASGSNVTITSTIPTTAVYAAISINKSSGFSAIEIVYSEKVISYVSYTS